MYSLWKGLRFAGNKSSVAGDKIKYLSTFDEGIKSHFIIYAIIALNMLLKMK